MNRSKEREQNDQPVNIRKEITKSSNVWDNCQSVVRQGKVVPTNLVGLESYLYPIGVGQGHPTLGHIHVWSHSSYSKVKDSPHVC